VRDGAVLAQSGGRYVGPAVWQSLLDLPAFDSMFPVIGGWVVAGEAVGIGVREGGRITTNRDRFVPHVIEG
jgi:glutathionylspermidine synthase